MNSKLESGSGNKPVKLLTTETNEKGEVTKMTTASNEPFISENGNFKIIEFFMIKGTQDNQEQTFFCLVVDFDAVGSLEYGEVGAIVKLSDGSKIECTQFSQTESDESPSGTFSLINLKDPDLSIKIDGTSISVNPQEAIDANWKKLAITPVTMIKVCGSNNSMDYLPNPKFTDFPAQNLFIEHLKALK